MLVIEVNHLQKRYRDHLAVCDISFTVEQGEIFGIIGPNGAGRPPRSSVLKNCQYLIKGRCVYGGLFHSGIK